MGDPVADDAQALLDFTQADQQLSLILTQDASVTAVRLVLGPFEP